jgi:PAS domain S-box-containing protein
VTPPIDVSLLSTVVDDRAVFMAATYQAGEAVIVTDSTPVIRYANPRALLNTGYELEEVIGQNPRIFQSGLHDPSFYEQMWERLAGGHSWSGLLLNRRKDGEVYEESAIITPVRGDDGAVVAYVATKRDLSVERGLEEDISRRQSNRDSLVALMNTVRPGESIEATSAAFCDAVTQIDGMDGAIVFMLQDDGTVIAASADPEPMPGFAFGRHIPVPRLQEIVEETVGGPWVLDVSASAEHPEMPTDLLDVMRERGIVAAGYAAIRWNEELVGVVSVATLRPDGVHWLKSRAGALEEISSFAGAILGRQALQYRRHETLRREIRDIIDNSLYHPVFQPVMNLRTNLIGGYEALTRFDDGCAPDIRFAEAHSVGLGPDLEAVCAAVAVETVRHLPVDVWLSINFSADAILDGHAAAVVAKANRPVVVEITEHAVIESYPALRQAITRGGDVLLSVDDAGAGFASLRHILELDPDIVKLDIGLIRGIDRDPARQALVAGMRHFGLKTGTTLIAEGVETAAEAETVRDLGVELGQGYLYGRPRVIEAP